MTINSFYKTLFYKKRFVYYNKKQYKLKYDT